MCQVLQTIAVASLTASNQFDLFVAPTVSHTKPCKLEGLNWVPLDALVLWFSYASQGFKKEGDRVSCCVCSLKGSAWRLHLLDALNRPPKALLSSE